MQVSKGTGQGVRRSKRPVGMPHPSQMFMEPLKIRPYYANLRFNIGQNMPLVLACFLWQFWCNTCFCKSILCYVCMRCLKDFCGKKRIKDSFYLFVFARTCSSYECFILRPARLSSKLLGQGHVRERLKSSLRKFNGRYGDLIKHYEAPLSQMLHDILGLGHLQ